MNPKLLRWGVYQESGTARLQSREWGGSRRREQESRRRESSKRWSKVKWKPGGCHWGSICRYFHSEEVGRVEQVKLLSVTK